MKLFLKNGFSALILSFLAKNQNFKSEKFKKYNEKGVFFRKKLFIFKKTSSQKGESG